MPFHVSRIILSPATKNLNSKPTLDFSNPLSPTESSKSIQPLDNLIVVPLRKKNNEKLAFLKPFQDLFEKRKGEKRPIAVFISPSSFFDDRNRFSLQFSIIQRPLRNASSSPSLLNLYESLSSTLARHGRGRQSHDPSTFHEPDKETCSTVEPRSLGQAIKQPPPMPGRRRYTIANRSPPQTPGKSCCVLAPEVSRIEARL